MQSRPTPCGQRPQPVRAVPTSMPPSHASARKRPQPPRSALNATLIQLLVLEEELRPRRMTAYGALSDEAAHVLETHVQRLVDLTQTLITQHEHGR